MSFKKGIIIILVIFIMAALLPINKVQALSVSAQSAILMEQTTGRVIMQKDAHKIRRIASITKIMTAILAIESEKMNEMVKISQSASRTEGSSLYLKAGQKMKLEDLVYGLMLRSGNDSAVAIAEHVGGSLDGFVFLMNQKAEEIGMKNTHFSNPHGLDDHEDHFSTAYDMALLTRYAMLNDMYRKISGTKVHHAPNPNEKWDYKWTNKNRLLTEKYSYCTGGKTGYTKRAKRTLVTTAEKDGMELIAVTLNAPSDWQDHIYMYEKTFDDYDMTNILKKGKIKKVKDKIYKNKVYIENSYRYPITDKEVDLFKINYKLVKPKEKWKDNEIIPEIVGKVNIYFKDELVKTMPIYYKHEPDESSKSFMDWFKNVFGYIIGVKHYG